VDPATLIGIGMAFGAIVVSMVMEGGNPASIILPPPILLVFLGTIGVAVAGGVMKDATGLIAGLKGALLGGPSTGDDTIATVVDMAERARREGLLALEEAAKNIDDPFLRKGIELAVDGTDPEEIRAIMSTEVGAKKTADKAMAQIFADMGAYAPTIGIIGTVLGLIHVLENLSEPEKLGHLISGAFVATLWGVLTANVMWLPMSKKLKRVSDQECQHMLLIVEGVLSVQAGSNPRVIEQKLLSYLPPAERAAHAVTDSEAA
jgi:chemotaxis protein MotA